jgi:catechol 2,3-dioxygenase-like lactoylglutathione lyase family enzyme
MKITELTLATPHPDEMKKFYGGALGLKPDQILMDFHFKQVIHV